MQKNSLKQRCLQNKSKHEGKHFYMKLRRTVNCNKLNKGNIWCNNALLFKNASEVSSTLYKGL